MQVLATTIKIKHFLSRILKHQAGAHPGEGHRGEMTAFLNHIWETKKWCTHIAGKFGELTLFEHLQLAKKSLAN